MENCMKLCSKCKKRPAVVFLSDVSNPNAEPNGLCLVCAKELGIKPIDDMLKKMNISDEDIEAVRGSVVIAEDDDEGEFECPICHEMLKAGTAVCPKCGAEFEFE